MYIVYCTCTFYIAECAIQTGWKIGKDLTRRIQQGRPCLLCFYVYSHWPLKTKLPLTTSLLTNRHPVSFIVVWWIRSILFGIRIRGSSFKNLDPDST